MTCEVILVPFYPLDIIRILIINIPSAVIGIANHINTFQPDVLCIGGGISREGDTLIKPIKEFVKGENFARNVAKKTEIKTAMLGNNAGIIGAAFLADLYK